MMRRSYADRRGRLMGEKRAMRVRMLTGVVGRVLVAVGLLAACLVLGSVAVPVSPAAAAPLQWESISTGYSHSCGVTTDGVGYCWGSDGNAELGDGDVLAASGVPSPVAGGHVWKSITAGVSHSCGVTTDGVGYCWGWGGSGRLGDGAASWSGVPSPVAGGYVWKSITAGGVHSCGVTTDGVGYCWGSDGNGQLGNGDASGSRVPSLVAGGLVWDSITVGSYHSCGVTTTGVGYCWGSDGNGQLGDGAVSAGSGVPLLVDGSHLWKSISAGVSHSCGVTTDGDGFCWGLGGDGRLGDGAASWSGVPSPVAGGYVWKSITAGGAHSCGVTTDGDGFCWGLGGDGQLGDGDASGSAVPSPVFGGPVWESITAGYWHSCGVTTTGVGYCWGYDGHGQLGDGDVSAGSSVPSAVAGPVLSGQVITFDAVDDHMLGSGSFVVLPVADSGLVVTVVSSTPLVCGVEAVEPAGSGWLVSLSGVGVCTLVASQGGDSGHLAATPVERSFEVTAGAATVNVAGWSMPWTGLPRPVGVSTVPSGLATNVSYMQGGVAVVPVEPGSYDVVVSLNDPNWVASPVVGTFVVTKASQLISLGTPVGQTFGDGAQSVSVSSSSGLTVTVSASGPCQVTGQAAGSGTVTATGAGTCTLSANQAGDDHHEAAAQVDVSFVIAKAAAEIVSVSGGPFTYDANPHGVVVDTDPDGVQTGVTYDGSAAEPIDAGTYGVEVAVTDPNYTGSPVSGSLTINAAVPTLTVAGPGSVVFGDGPVGVSASSNSPASITWTAAGPCTIAGTTVSFAGGGTCTVTANQDGDAPNWVSTSAHSVIAVAAAPTTTVLVGPDDPTLVGTEAVFTATVSSTAGTVAGPITFTAVTSSGTVSETVPTVDGVGVWSPTTLAPGSVTVTAEFTATDSFGSSTSDPVVHGVVTAPVSLTGLAAQVFVGDEVSVTATGFVPAESVTFTMHSDPVEVGAVIADAFGTATLTFVIPTVTVGHHRLVAVGQSSATTASAMTLVLAGQATPPARPETPTNPTGPTVPADPAGPTNPTVPTNPTDPTGPTGPTNPTEPTEPEHPIVCGPETTRCQNPNNPSDVDGTTRPHGDIRPAGEAGRALPRTGSNTATQTGLALALIAAGIALVALERHHTRLRTR